MATERQVGSQAAGTGLSVFRHRPQVSRGELDGELPTDATQCEEVKCLGQ